MALNNEMKSVQREDSLRNVMTSLDSTIAQLETTESSNTQLQQKVQYTVILKYMMYIHVLVCDSL